MLEVDNWSGEDSKWFLGHLGNNDTLALQELMQKQFINKKWNSRYRIVVAETDEMKLMIESVK